MIAIGVGYFFSLVGEEEVAHIDLVLTGCKVDVCDCRYEVYKGKTFKDSQMIDKLLDTRHEFKIEDYEYKGE